MIQPRIFVPLYDPVYLQDMTETQRLAIRNAALRFRKYATTSVVVGWNPECCMLLHPRRACTANSQHHHEYTSHLMLQFTDVRQTTTISVLGSSHAAVGRLATWLWSGPTKPSHVHIYGLMFDFSILSTDSLRNLAHCSSVRFTNCTMTAEQTALVASLLENDKTIAFSDCKFADGGSAFLDALSSRDNSGGRLEIVPRQESMRVELLDKPSLLRLFQQDFFLECLKVTSHLFRTHPNMLLMPFSAKTKMEYTLYHADEAAWQQHTNGTDGLHIRPSDFHLIVHDAQQPELTHSEHANATATDMVLPQLFFRACRHSKHLKKLGFSYHRSGGSTPVPLPQDIQTSLCQALDANDGIQELTLDCGCTYDWKAETKGPSLMNVLATHRGLRTLTLVVHQKSDPTLVTHLFSLLQLNRHFEVRFHKSSDSGFTPLVWEHQLRSILVFNRFYRSTLALCQWDPYRFHVWCAGIRRLQQKNHYRVYHSVQCEDQPTALNHQSIRKMALFLQHHTDLLCLLVNEVIQDQSTDTHNTE